MQNNFCIKLLRQTKEKYFNNVNVKKVSDNGNGNLLEIS